MDAAPPNDPPPAPSHCDNLRRDISVIFKMVGEASYVKYLATILHVALQRGVKIAAAINVS